MVDQFIETWRINNRVNLFLMENISDEALHASTSSNGNGTPAKLFAHVHNVRIWKLESHDEYLLDGQSKIEITDNLSRELLRQKLIETEEAIAKLLRRGVEKDGAIEGFRRGVMVLQGYLISHESHHRGKIMFTLKECGFQLPKSVTYGIWNWDEI